MPRPMQVGLFIALATFGASAIAQSEPGQGQKQFETQCAASHSVKPGIDGFGPSLAGVVGKAAGKAPGPVSRNTAFAAWLGNS